MVNQITRFTLNQKQLHLLALLYKFRYVTIPSLTHYKNLKSNSLQRNLYILYDQGYIGKTYNSSFKIDRKPAYYYLAKKGVALLKADERFNAAVLNTYYKNSFLSDAFKQHCVDTLAAYNALHQTYGERYRMFVMSELAGLADFPETKPDLFLRAIDNTREYFITLAHDVQPFLIRKRLAEYIDHSEDVGWEAADHYPTLLFVFGNSGQERRFLDHAADVLESMGIGSDELPIGATTLTALCTKPYTDAVWTFVGSDMPVALS